jgi:lipid-A-disaccharide synthase
VRAACPDVKVAVLVAPTREEAEIRSKLADEDGSVVLIKEDPFLMISLADVVLCAAGTATLMIGLTERPMVIMYRINPVTVFLARWFVTPPAHFGMINLILGERVAPEFFQKDASPEALSGALLPLVQSAEMREAVRSKLAQAKDLLGRRGATERVARILAPYLEAR